jgi:hypothetical protein
MPAFTIQCSRCHEFSEDLVRTECCVTVLCGACAASAQPGCRCGATDVVRVPIASDNSGKERFLKKAVLLDRGASIDFVCGICDEENIGLMRAQCCVGMVCFTCRRRANRARIPKERCLMCNSSEVRHFFLGTADDTNERFMHLAYAISTIDCECGESVRKCDFVQHLLDAHPINDESTVERHFSVNHDTYQRIGSTDKSHLAASMLASPLAFFFISIESLQRFYDAQLFWECIPQVGAFAESVRAAELPGGEEYLTVLELIKTLAERRDSSLAREKVERLAHKLDTTRITRSMSTLKVEKLKVMKVWVTHVLNSSAGADTA